MKRILILPLLVTLCACDLNGDGIPEWITGWSIPTPEVFCPPGTTRCLTLSCAAFTGTETVCGVCGDGETWTPTGDERPDFLPASYSCWGNVNAAGSWTDDTLEWTAGSWSHVLHIVGPGQWAGGNGTPGGLYPLPGHTPGAACDDWAATVGTWDASVNYWILPLWGIEQ